MKSNNYDWNLIILKTSSYAAPHKLNDNTYYTAYLSLSEPTEYGEFYRRYSEKKLQCGDMWCGVYTENTSPDLLGFSPELSGKCMDWNRSTYPKLCLLDNESSVESIEANVSSVSAMQKHFLSLIHYMDDNRDVMKMFCVNEIDWYNVGKYIEENGLYIYGFAVTADKDTILKFAEDTAVSYVYVTPLQ